MAIIFDFLFFLLQIYSLVIIARAFLSWFPNIDYNNPLVRLLIDLTEPVLQPVRQLQRQAMPNMMMDFSPVIVLIGIYVLRIVLVNLFF